MIVDQFHVCSQMQLDFADLSGDVNPQHVDPTAARRLMFGKPVVHGVHSLMRVLEIIVKQQPKLALLSSLRVSFDEPVGIGDSLRLEAETNGYQVKFVLLRGAQRAARGRLDFSDAAPNRHLAAPVEIGECRNVGEDELERRSGALLLGADPTLLAKIFPTLATGFDLGQVALLLATTRLVGMECPGLHSIYGSLKLHFAGPTVSTLNYRVSTWSPTHRMLQLALDCGGISGAIDCFLRPPPVAQPTLSTVAQLIQPGEFAGHHLLVIGGSRGLGETAAKIGAAGGARVTLTYAKGTADGARVAAEITDAGGQATALRYDVLAPDPFPAPNPPFTLLLYFATPPIRPNRGPALDANLLADLVGVYAIGFLRTFEAVRPHLATQATLCMPSTIFIDESEHEFREYAAAKHAAEVLAAHLSMTGLRVICPRLPRLRTDQTSALTDVGAADSLQPMIKLMRACAG